MKFSKILSADHCDMQMTVMTVLISDVRFLLASEPYKGLNQKMLF